ncbi:MAG: hypothetical protein K6G33_06740 [Ruminococcus sp.]|uniref:hypothetical protein n=1 Tax=Ruminococcus sp. TaxID=41978 RepID=UPI0025E2113A|nr:hypothetical protein [Ruminococcus sp.]MCR5600416.1 hypothetical protein [Ruminococcus sp.]
MKRELFGFSAFIFAAALVGCGADKEKNADNKDKAETTTVAENPADSIQSATIDSNIEITTVEENTAEEDNIVSKSAPDIKEYAGELVLTGFGTINDGYPDIDANKIIDASEDDPATISEDGTLHFNGKDYKLIPEGVIKPQYSDKDLIVYSIEGSGFDFDKYSKNVYSLTSRKCLDKDYEGPAFLTISQWDTHSGDEDYSYNLYSLQITEKGDDDSALDISSALKGSHGDPHCQIRDT